MIKYAPGLITNNTVFTMIPLKFQVHKPHSKSNIPKSRADEWKEWKSITQVPQIVNSPLSDVINLDNKFGKKTDKFGCFQLKLDSIKDGHF